jgi:hypothetical protein
MVTLGGPYSTNEVSKNLQAFVGRGTHLPEATTGVGSSFLGSLQCQLEGHSADSGRRSLGDLSDGDGLLGTVGESLNLLLLDVLCVGCE